MILQELRHSFRLLLKSPGFTTVAVLSMMLGIGVNTAMFSVINAVVLRSLPYPQPSQLVRLGQQGGRGEVSLAEYQFWKQHTSAYSSLAAYRGGSEKRLVSGDTQEWAGVMTATADLFRTLGIRPAMGREFTAEEASTGGPQAIILSDSLWRRDFGGDPRVLGRTILLDDVSYLVVGILPPKFWFPQFTDAVIPLRPSGSLDDQGMNTQVVGRLAGAVTIRQAQAEIGLMTDDLRRSQTAGSSASGDRRVVVIPFQEWLVGDLRSNFLLLFGATGLVLVISCANVATLLLTRTAARKKEIAVRLALGTSRRRLMGQFLTENLVLSALGAVTGLMAANWLLRGLVAWMPFHLPAFVTIRLDAAVLAFSLALVVVTALAFTMIPLLSVGRLNVQETLKSGNRGTGIQMRARTRHVLVVAEVAISTTLLIGAGLLIQSLYRMHQEQLGFLPQRLMTFQTPLPSALQENTPARWNFAQALLQHLKVVPGITGAAAINVLPLSGQGNLPAQRFQHPDQSIGGMEIRAVTLDYFELMSIPLRRGRSLAGTDTAASPHVVLINETLAKAWWPHGNAVGDRVLIGRLRERELFKDTAREVIGIVGDTKTKLKDPPRPTIYLPLTQTDPVPVSNLAWIVRSEANEGLAPQIVRVVGDVDPRQRIRLIRTMEEIVESATITPRFNAWLYGLFAMVALALAAVGVYGLLSFLVTQRNYEIGTRIAVGATSSDISRLFLRQGLWLTTIGLLLGLGGAFLLTRSLSTLLFGVQPNDPWNFAIVSLLVALVGSTAALFPAFRATRVDPIRALRNE